MFLRVVTRKIVMCLQKILNFEILNPGTTFEWCSSSATVASC